MFLTNLFNLKKACQHDKISPDMECGYCPDCGKFIQNEWYIARCDCCGVKIKAMTRNGEIVSQNHFCTNCGSDKYHIEKLNKINFIDINYAVLQKKEVSQKKSNDISTTQCWLEKTSMQPKLLTQYL